MLNWAEDAGKLVVAAATVKNAEGASQQELVDLDDPDCRIRWNSGTDSFEIKPVYAAYSEHPAVEVSWYGAVAWCNYRSDMDGVGRCYSFDDWICDWTKGSCRLPTESEWEYACRAGTTTAFHTGGITSLESDPNMDTAGWYRYNSDTWSGRSTHPVADPSKTANAWGLSDMHGNVWEWCWDRFGSYPAGPRADPHGPASGADRVLRGGGWRYSASDCRAAFRRHNSPDNTFSAVGFRPVRRAVP